LLMVFLCTYFSILNNKWVAAGSPPADDSRAGNPAAPTETINFVDGFFLH
jgi:hypothetical protein